MHKNVLIVNELIRFELHQNQLQSNETSTLGCTIYSQLSTGHWDQRLYECGGLGPANSPNPAQLQRTVWFYLVLYFGQRGRENQRQMKSNMLIFSFHRTWWTDLPTTAVQFQQLQRPNSQPLRPVRLSAQSYKVFLKKLTLIYFLNGRFFQLAARSRVYDRSCDVFAVCFMKRK